MNTSTPSMRIHSVGDTTWFCNCFSNYQPDVRSFHNVSINKDSPRKDSHGGA